MSDPPHLPEIPDNIEKERESNFALMLALGAAVVLLLIGGFYLVSRMTRSIRRWRNNSRFRWARGTSVCGTHSFSECPDVTRREFSEPGIHVRDGKSFE